MVADAFRRCQPQANPLAGQFIDQFIRHIDRTMTDSSEIQNLCWNVFEQNEEAYERMTQHLYYCRRRKYVTRFAALKTSILEGLNSASGLAVCKPGQSKGIRVTTRISIWISGWSLGQRGVGQGLQAQLVWRFPLFPVE